MISAFRRFLDTWYAKAFFVVMVGSFIFWGVGDVVRMIGTTTWVVKAGGQTIEGQAFQAEFQRGMAQATRDLPQGQEATPELKRRVGDATLQRMVGEAALGEVLHDMRIVTPDAAVASFVRSMPAFKDKDGQFSRQQFEAVLRNNGLNEPRFLQTVRADLAQRQLLGSVAAGAAAPAAESGPLYAALFEKRSADMVEFLFYNAPQAPPADEATLRRWYDNHPDIYATPEYRRIKAVVLSPQSLAGEIKVTDEDLRAAYERTRASYVTPGKRSAQVVSAEDETKAAALLVSWREAAKGADDWAAVQAAAQAQGAAAVALDDATEEQFPDPDLAKAVFAAEKNAITGPVKGALGWYLLKVTSATPGTEKTLDEVKGALRDRVLAEKATDIIYTRANTVDNLLANGGNLDDLPGDLGLAAVAGTLDAEGKTLDGSPAPIPGSPELRTALIAAAFQTPLGDSPRLTEAQPVPGSAGGSSYYALVVEEITPPGARPFETVRTRVAEDWTFDQQRRTQDNAATAMVASIQGGRSFADAATIAGVAPRLTPLVTRGQAVEGMPPELHRVLFGLKKNEPTMVETAEGFIVAVPIEILVPDPKDDVAAYEKMRTDLSRNIGNDFASVFQESLRQRASPRINQANFNQIVQP
jgi:peptidyl-prolyl cis-trans isomerase D